MATQMHSKYDSNYSRRTFLRTLGMATVAYGAGMLGCRSSQKASAQTLKFYGTGTLNVEKAGWDKLRQDLNIDLIFQDNGNDTGPIITRMITGTAAYDFDLGGLQGGAERELAQAGKILPWDLNKIPNWNSMWEWARAIPYTIFQGKQYGLPSVINADSMIYLPKRVGDIDSYFAVFDPKLRGKTAMEDAWINSVIFTAIYLKENSLQQIVNPGDLTDSELGAVMEFLIKKKKDGQFRTFWNGWENGLSLITSEEVYVMTGWEPIVYAAQAKGINAKYAVPKEGYEGWSNDLLLHVGAEKHGTVEAAHQFANWEMAGYYGCLLENKRGYVVPTNNNIQSAKAHPSECDVDKTESIAKNVEQKFRQMKGSVYWQNVRPREYKLYEEWWSRLRSA